MGKKNRSRKRADPGNGQGFSVNPFADLDRDDLQVSPEADDMTSETPARDPECRERPAPDDDKRPADLPTTEIEFTAPQKAGISLQVQRKGRGGKTVTRVLGLNELSVIEGMQLVGQLKKDLGVGAHVREGVIELHGDLRERAANWFTKNNFRVKGK